MENGGDGKSQGKDDFYQVMGMEKECTASELRTAYRKLALRWHPDRCSASGNSKFTDESKKKFQGIQQAYSVCAVLSDDNKRFLYDVGVYDCGDDQNGMGDFMNEMAIMMSQTKPSKWILLHWGPRPFRDFMVMWPTICSYPWNLERDQLIAEENGVESFEQLQALFVEMFQGDIGSLGSPSIRGGTSSSSTSSSYYSFCESSSSNGLETATSSESSVFDSHFQKFCLGTGGSSSKVQEGGGSKKRSSRNRRSQKGKCHK